MKAATNTSGNGVPGFQKLESRLQVLLFGVPNHLVFFFWLLSGVARRYPYSQRAHAEADRQGEGH
jgi:hypothetical protein